MAMSLSDRYNKRIDVRFGDQEGHSVLSPNPFFDYEEVQSLGVSSPLCILELSI